MSHLNNYLQKAKIDSSEEGLLKVQLKTLLGNIESEREHTKERLEHELEPIGEEFAYLEGLIDLYRWKSREPDDPYRDGFVPAVEQFWHAYEDTQRRGWDRVASLWLDQLVTLHYEIGGHDEELADVFEEAVEFLETIHADDPGASGYLHGLVETLAEYVDRMDEELVDRCLNLWSDKAEYYREQEDYRLVREYLELAITFKQSMNRSISEEQEQLITSFEHEAEQKGERSHSVKAEMYRSGLERCIDFLDDETEAEWKRRIREANREAIESEFTRVPTRNQMWDDLEEEIEHNVEVILEAVRNKQQETNTIYALYTLLKSNFYVPPVDVPGSEEPSIISRISQTSISREGDPIEIRRPQTGEGETSNEYPPGYRVHFVYYDEILSRVFSRLIAAGDVSAVDLLQLFDLSNGCDVHDFAFLTDALFRLFEENYSSALHITIGRFDGMLRRSFEQSGFAVTVLDEDAIRGRELGGLFEEIEEHISADYGKYLKYRFTEKSGFDLRNKTSHGRLTYLECDFPNTILSVFHLHRCIIHIERSRYGAIFPEPVKLRNMD